MIAFRDAEAADALFQQVAGLLGISRSYVSRLETRALKQLQTGLEQGPPAMTHK